MFLSTVCITSNSSPTSRLILKPTPSKSPRDNYVSVKIVWVPLCMSPLSHMSVDHKCRFLAIGGHLVLFQSSACRGEQGILGGHADRLGFCTGSWGSSCLFQSLPCFGQKMSKVCLLIMSYKCVCVCCFGTRVDVSPVWPHTMGSMAFRRETGFLRST